MGKGRDKRKRTQKKLERAAQSAESAQAAPQKTRSRRDFLDEIVAEGEVRSPGFAQKVDEAYKRRTEENANG